MNGNRPNKTLTLSEAKEKKGRSFLIGANESQLEYKCPRLYLEGNNNKYLHPMNICVVVLGACFPLDKAAFFKKKKNLPFLQIFRVLENHRYLLQAIT